MRGKTKRNNKEKLPERGVWMDQKASDGTSAHFAAGPEDIMVRLY
jgi:hypothetical protein